MTLGHANRLQSMSLEMPKRSTPIIRLLLACALLLGTSAGALAQGERMMPPLPVAKPPLPAAITPPAPSPTAPAATPAPSPPKPWSGESGASGHPLMQASAIRQAAANFESCVAGLWPLAAKRKISRASFEKYTRGLSPDLHIMDLLDAQP